MVRAEEMRAVFAQGEITFPDCNKSTAAAPNNIALAVGLHNEADPYAY